MSTACALFFGKLLRSCHKPLIQHVVSRGRRSHAYYISMMRHRASLFPYAPTHRNTFLEWNYDAEIYAFANRIGEKFDKQILETALIDRSHIHSQIQKQEEAGLPAIEAPEDNSKLADTGKVIIRCVVDRYLRTVLPKFPDQGIMAVVNHLSGEEVALSIGKGLGIDELVMTPDFPVPTEVTLKAFYAVVGAVYESAGLERAALFVRDFVIAKLNETELNSLWVPDDPVESLNSFLNEQGHSPAEPRLIHRSGMNTVLASYRVGMYLDRKYLGAGNGESVNEAVKFAALDVLWRLWSTAEGSLVLPFDLDPKVFLQTSSLIPLLDESREGTALSESTAA